MANQDGFIDYLSENALKDLREGNTLILQSIENVKKLNALKSTTPSGSNDLSAQLAQQVRDQAAAIAELQRKLTDLAATKRSVNTQTTQEIVNNGILNRTARQAAVVNSTLAGAYQKLSAEQAKSATNVQNIVARGIKATQTKKQYNAELSKAQKEFDNLNRRVLLADRAVGRFNRNVGNYPQIAKGFTELLGAFGVIGGVAAIAAVSKSIFNTTRELQSMDLALRQVLGSSEEAAKAQEFLMRVSDAYGISIQTLTKSYIGFFASAKNAMDSGAISADEIRQIFESVSKAAGAMGLSIEQQDGAFLALSQMISKGNIQAEELRGQLSERLPGAFGILAKSMGVTEIELNKLLKDGKVLAAEVLPAFARELEKAYGVENLGRVESLNASTTRLSNAWTDFIRALNEGDGIFSKTLTTLVESLANIVKGFEFLAKSASQVGADRNKKARTDAYNEYLAYYKSLEKLDVEQIERTRKYNLEKASLLQEEIEQLAKNGKEIEKNFVSNAIPGAAILNAATAYAIGGNNDEIRRKQRLINRLYGEIEAGTEVQKKENKEVKKNTELNKAQLDALKKLAEERAKNSAAREISDLERQKKLLEDRFEEENQYAEDRVKLSQAIADKEYSIEARRFIENIRLHKNSLDLMAIDANNFRTATEEAEKRNLERIKEIRFKAIDEENEYREKYQGEGLKFDLPSGEDFWQKQQEDIEKTAEALRELQQEMNGYLSGLSSEVLQGAGFSNLFAILNKEIAGFGKNYKKEFQELEMLKKTGALSDEEYADKYKQLNDSKLQSQLTTGLAISESIQELTNFLIASDQARYDAQYAQLEQQKNIAILFAGESATAREEIERQYEERRKEIQRRQAESAKKNAIFNILINTAQGIVAALASVPPNVPLSIAIGAIGAIQAGIVSSQQIPEFYKGTDNAPEGWAWTQERGREIITDKNDRVKDTGSDSGRKLTYLKSGDKVKNAMQSKEIFEANMNRVLMNSGIMPVAAEIINNREQSAGIDYDKLAQTISNGFKSAPQPTTYALNVDERGINTAIINGATKTISMNAKLKLTPKRT